MHVSSKSYILSVQVAWSLLFLYNKRIIIFNIIYFLIFFVGLIPPTSHGRPYIQMARVQLPSLYAPHNNCRKQLSPPAPWRGLPFKQPFTFNVPNPVLVSTNELLLVLAHWWRNQKMLTEVPAPPSMYKNLIPNFYLLHIHSAYREFFTNQKKFLTQKNWIITNKANEK